MATQSNKKEISKINFKREVNQAKIIAFTMRHF